MGTDGHMTCACASGQIKIDGYCSFPLDDADCAETNQVPNWDGSACVDPPVVCQSPSVRDPETNTCVAGPGQENCDPQSGTIWDESLGYCRAPCGLPSTWDDTLDRCVFPDVPPVTGDDTDGDGIPDSEDDDDDGDGLPDDRDTRPGQGGESRDTDHDGIDDDEDEDDDGDGIPDTQDTDDNDNEVDDRDEDPAVQFGTVEDVALKNDERKVELRREMSASGSCPAPVEMDLVSFGISRSSFSLEWTPVCDFARGVRPFVIIGALLGAALFLFNLLKPS
jgi:hypothetical protein